MELLFQSNDNLSIGWANNVSCFAHKLILDPREPPDPLADPACWRLRYPPLAVLVRPAGMQLRDPPLCAGLPGDVVPVGLCHRKFTLKLAAHPRVAVALKLQPPNFDVSVTVTNIPLVPACVFTDYWAQGLTINKPHATPLDLSIPRGGIKATNLFVAITRCRGIHGQFALIRPIWPHDDQAARDQALKKLLAAFKKNPALESENDRLDQLARRTSENCDM